MPIVTPYPVAATPVAPPGTLAFDVVDTDNGVAGCLVMADQGGRREIVYDGSNFLAPYSGSKVVLSDTHWQFQVRRALGGWVDPVVLYVLTDPRAGGTSAPTYAQIATACRTADTSLEMNGQKVTGLSPGSEPTDAATVSQIGGGASDGTFAERPAAGTRGRIYLPTDEGAQAYDDGSAWRPIIGGMLCKRVDLASLSTAVFDGTFTAAQRGDSVLLSRDVYSGSGGTATYGARLQAGTSVVVSARVITDYYSGIVYGGAILRESSSGRAVTLGVGIVAGEKIALISACAFRDQSRRDEYTNFPFMYASPPTFLRLTAAGQTCIMQVGFSPTGPWYNVNGFNTAGRFDVAADQVGIFLASELGTGHLLVEHFEGT